MADYWDQYEAAVEPFRQQMTTPRTVDVRNAPLFTGEITPGRYTPAEIAYKQERSAARGAAVPTTGTEGTRTTQPVPPPGTAPTRDIGEVIREWQSQHPHTTDIAELYTYLRGLGYNVERPTHAGGTQISADKLVLPDQQVIDLRTDTGWTYAPNNYWVGGKPSATPGVYTPFPEQPGGGLPGGYGLGGINNLASFTAPGLIAPWTQQFQRPDPNQIAQDPSFQFQMGEGMKAIERSAASKGSLLTGGTLKDLTGYAQGLAHTYDDKYYNRALGEYGMNRDIFWGNQTNAFNRLSGLTNTGLTAAGYANQAGSTYGTNAANLVTGQGNVDAAGRVVEGNASNQTIDRWGNIIPRVIDIFSSQGTRTR